MRTVIVDDERLARQRIRRLLQGEPDVEIVGEFANARQASEQLRSAPPDLLFLDVQMPRANGFELLQGMPEGAVPAVIFVTAYEQYAVKAFAVRAQDYLLKPFEESRFRVAVQRAREAVRRSEGAALDERILKMLETADDRRGSHEAVLVRSAGKIRLLKIGEIDWIESADNYARLHVGAESHLVRETMAAFEAKLQRLQFARIHRSTIVNTQRIREFQQWFNGDYLVILNDGQKLRMSRTYRERVQDLLGHSI